MPFYRPVHTGPLAKLVSYFFAADLAVVAKCEQRNRNFELLRNLVQSRVGPQIHRAIGEGRSREASPGDFVLAECLEFDARLDPRRNSGFIQKQNTTVRQDR
jgi:hypothetical protein